MIRLEAKPPETIRDTKTIHNLLLNCLERLTICLGRSGKGNGTDKLGADYDFLDGYNQLYLIHFDNLPHITEILSSASTVLTAKNKVLELLQR